jgi:tRNA-uridine 2-sulfurtransferase
MFGFGKKGTVFVGLSGGVDSAVSAALLKREGYKTVGVFIRIVIPGYPCTAGQDRLEAMRAAAYLQIPFIEIDLSEEYEAEVFKQSLSGFAKGETPNPDTLCNREIKFGAFYRFAKAQGAEYIATGHYAQIKNNELYAGKDADKDQSYFLWSVPQEALAHTLFPVGGMRKIDVRTLAKRFGLPNAQRKDSQGLCFLGPISLTDMLKRELKPHKGDVLSETGEIIGTHEGAVLYTLGQRHGFVLFAGGPHTPPHFVIGKDEIRNTITISTERFPVNVSRSVLTLRECNWIGPCGEGEYQARFRYRQKLIPARLSFADTQTQVTLEKPHWVPEGQSLVLYDGERALGGGVVDGTALR